VNDIDLNEIWTLHRSHNFRIIVSLKGKWMCCAIRNVLFTACTVLRILMIEWRISVLYYGVSSLTKSLESNVILLWTLDLPFSIDEPLSNPQVLYFIWNFWSFDLYMSEVYYRYSLEMSKKCCGSCYYITNLLLTC